MKRNSTVKRSIGLFAMGVIIMMWSVMSISLPKSVLADTSSVPKTLKIMSYELGASSYMAYAFIGEYTLKKYGTKIRVIPCGNDVGKMVALRSNLVDFIGGGFDLYYAMNGVTDRYTQRAWGPQNQLRVAWLGVHPGQCIAVRGDSDIKTVADLKGRRLTWILGSSLNEAMVGHLSYANLSWDDVKKAKVAGYNASMKAVLDGSADAVLALVASGTMYEIEASPYGLRWLAETDPEGIERVRTVLPPYVPFVATIGAGISKDKPLNCMSYAYPATICNSDLDEEKAYFLTKSIVEGYDEMAQQSDIMKNYWKVESFMHLYENYDFAILHAGTVKYLKEAGYWKPEYDKLQKERIKKYDSLRDLWTEVEEESLDKKIKDKHYAKFWMEKRTEYMNTIGK